MKHKLYFLILLFLYFNCSFKCYAIFGAGDIVFDPANVAQTINVLKAAQGQLDMLGTILGISTKQLDQLTNLAFALGNSTDSKSISPALTDLQINDILKFTPGYDTLNLNKLFDKNGILDAFMGVSLKQWIQAVENPTNFYRQNMINSALARIGSNADLTSPTIAYTEWYSSLSLDERHILNDKANADLSDLLNSYWLGESKTRLVNLQELSVQSKAAYDESIKAASLSDQHRTQTQLEGITNNILLEAASQTESGQETVIRTNIAENVSMQNLLGANRDSSEIVLNIN
jgi:hypothetical protein